MASNTNSISTGIRCPSCQGPMTPRVLGCSSCDLKVEGCFHSNEFASLNDDELHLLRIFVRTEGSIREMESSLGLSYPTIKSRLTELKKRLGLGNDGAKPISEQISEPISDSSKAFNPATAEEALQMLQRGELSYDEALTQIKKLKPTAKSKSSKA